MPRVLKANRRGVVEVQFNWIFVLIAGGIILFFFINLSMRQKEVSTRRLSGELLQDLELIITGQSVSVGRTTVLDLPPVEIGLTCDSYTILQQASSMRNSIVFGPPLLIGPKLIAWTQDLRAPFRVTNFVYLTSSGAKYYLLYDSGLEELAADLRDALPLELDVTIAPLSDADTLSPENRPLVRFVYLLGGPSTIEVPAQFRDLDNPTSALTIAIDDPDAEGRGWGMTFLTQQRPGEPFTELGSMPSTSLPALYGAIYTPDFEHYQCDIRKALERLVVVSRIYQRRTAFMHDAIRPECRRFFADAEFDELERAGLNGLEGDFSAMGFFDPIAGAVDQLSRRVEAATIVSCPWLY